MKRIFLVAGESSGDIHGGNLVRALREADPDAFCEGLGGRHMAEAGMALRHNLAERGIMGFTEVVQSLRYLRRLYYDTVNHLARTRPSCLVLIDYPGFNLRLAKTAKQLGIPVVYYISPQVWAWKRKRIHTLARTVDKMLVILPFEERLYREVGLDCVYVGHPLLDYIASVPVQGVFRGDCIIGLMPGSRAQEIRRLMPLMLQVAQEIQHTYPEARFITPCVDTAREAQVRAAAGDFPLETVVGQTYELLDGARFCLVASGTATLEAALFRVPMAVVYKVSPLSFWIARRLVRVEHIALANILAEKQIVPEFVQGEASMQNVTPAALELLEDTPRRASVLTEYARLREKLGETGASRKAAAGVLEVAKRGSDV
ncbi:MAG: lipid-A-disaccharide synthase [Candidatus Hydrogenedentota bacterium]